MCRVQAHHFHCLVLNGQSLYKRIIELNEIVTEVKESEEWEGIRMNILDIGIQEGERRGIEAMIKACKKLSASRDKVQELLKEEFSLNEEKANEYMEMYW